MGQAPSTIQAPVVKPDHPKKCQSAHPPRCPTTPTLEVAFPVILALSQPPIQEAATVNTITPATTAAPPPPSSPKPVPVLPTTHPITVKCRHTSRHPLRFVTAIASASLSPSPEPPVAATSPPAHQTPPAPPSLTHLSHSLEPPLSVPSEPIPELSPTRSHPSRPKRPAKDYKYCRHRQVSSSITHSVMPPPSPKPPAATASPAHSSPPHTRPSTPSLPPRCSLLLKPPLATDLLSVCQSPVPFRHSQPTRLAKGHKRATCDFDAPSSSRAAVVPTAPSSSPPLAEPFSPPPLVNSAPLPPLSAVSSSSSFSSSKRAASSPSSREVSPEYIPMA